MAYFDRRSVKAAAVDSLQNAACDPKKLIFIHTGVALILSLVMTVVDYLLNLQIDATGGLDGIGLRSFLSTAQSVLMMAQLLVVPAWTFGYTFVCLRLANSEEATPAMLLTGFRSYWRILRLQLLQAAIYFAIAFVCVYPTNLIFMLLPWSAPLQELMMQLMGGVEISDAAIIAVVDQISVPLVLTYLGVFLLLSLPFFYRYRMAPYILMSDPKKGALAALRESRRITRGSRLDLLKLDLSFWWFYGLELLLMLLSYGNLLLPALGVALPLSREVSYFLFFGLYLVGQLALDLWKMNEVSLTYVHVYDALRDPMNPKPQPGFFQQDW